MNIAVDKKSRRRYLLILLRAYVAIARSTIMENVY